MGLNVEVVRSKRKNSVGFSVKWPDIMVVSVPRSLTKNKLEEMINDRQVWAEKRLARLAADYGRLKLPKYYTGGETFPYLGRERPLTVIVSGSRTRPKCSLNGDRFTVEIPRVEEGEQPDLVKKALDKWYRLQAEQVLSNCVEKWTAGVGPKPASVQIRNQRSRWGSCSRKGAINLNWRLVLLPPELLEYVVVHELCHLRRPDHSPKYWALVEKSISDYKKKRNLLHTYSAYLDEI